RNRDVRPTCPRCQHRTPRFRGRSGPSRAAGFTLGCATMRSTPADPDRLARYRRGRLSEWMAAALLVAKGYRILGRRVRTPYGEIDLVAVRGSRLAFVEVKRRPTRLEAEAALTTRQRVRIARAAEFWVS